jgi:predicted RNA-binding protein
MLLVKDHRESGRPVAAQDGFMNRIKYRFWSFNKRAANLKRIRIGDRVVLYVAGARGGLFAGSATIASNPYPMSKIERDLTMGSPSKSFDYIVDLMDVEVWQNPVKFKEVYHGLTLIKNKNNPAVYLQGSVRKLNQEEFNMLRNTAGLPKDS